MFNNQNIKVPSKIIYILRIIVAIVCSILWIGVIPLYGMPFGGCEEPGFTTFEMGCSSWPNFFRGFGFVALLLLIAPRHFIFPLLSVSLMILVSTLGGFESVRMGDYLHIKNFNDFISLATLGLPELYGGALALFITMCLNHTLGRRKVANR